MAARKISEARGREGEVGARLHELDAERRVREVGERQQHEQTEPQRHRRADEHEQREADFDEKNAQKLSPSDEPRVFERGERVRPFRVEREVGREAEADFEPARGAEKEERARERDGARRSRVAVRHERPVRFVACRQDSIELRSRIVRVDFLRGFGERRGRLLEVFEGGFEARAVGRQRGDEAREREDEEQKDGKDDDRGGGERAQPREKEESLQREHVGEGRRFAAIPEADDAEEDERFRERREEFGTDVRDAVQRDADEPPENAAREQQPEIAAEEQGAPRVGEDGAAETSGVMRSGAAASGNHAPRTAPKRAQSASSVRQTSVPASISPAASFSENSVFVNGPRLTPSSVANQ